MNFISNIIYFFMNKEFMIFLLIGFFNTLFAMILTYSMYNLLHSGYYISSFTGTFSAAVLGFFLSYIVSFTLSHKLFLYIFTALNFDLSVSIIEQTAILFAQIIFTLLNFAGQKLWTFKNRGRI